VREPSISQLRGDFVAAAAVILVVTVGAALVHYLFGVV
jgi:hypothetical protein